MRSALAILICCMAPLARGAVGDITGAEVETNGFVLRMWVEGLNTNGNIFNGLGANNSLTGTQKLTLTLTSMGYDETAAATTWGRSVVGTKILRAPYPMQNTNDIQPNGDGCIVRLALSDFVYSKDSNLTLTALSGAYAVTNGTGTNSVSVSGLSITNGSTQNYQTAVANWSWPGNNRENGSAMRLRAVAFHRFGRDRKPVAAMQFVVEDENANIVTNVQTMMRIGSDLPDIIPTAEYIADVPISSFTNHDALRCDFRAYPWIGDSDAVLDTTLNNFTRPQPASITNLCDRLNNYSDAIAVVDPGGNDTNGRATNSAPEDVSSSHYFLTINAAANKIAITNFNSFGHGDTGGGIIYVRSGVTNWTGGTLSSSNTPKAWVTVKEYPGDEWIITTRVSNRDLGGKVKIQGAEIFFTDPQVMLSGNQQVWFDQCEIDSPGTALFQTTPLIYLTHSTIPRCAQGVRAQTTQNTAFTLVRGNNFDAFNGTHVFFTTIGNHRPDTNGYGMLFNNDGGGSGFGVPSSQFSIFYNNTFYGLTHPSDLLRFGHSQGITNGAAFVQNVIEYCTNNVNPNLVFVGTAAHNHSNLIVWNNVIVGKRCGFGYNDTGTSPLYKYHWSFRNNVIDISGFKSDTFGTPSGARIGNWPIMWGVGFAGNLFIETSYDQGSGQFPPVFFGLNSEYPITKPGSTNVITYARFRDRKSYIGSGDITAGGGDYRVYSDAPQRLFRVTPLLPFDLGGSSRGGIDPPGAYSSASPKRGGFF